MDYRQLLVNIPSGCLPLTLDNVFVSIKNFSRQALLRSKGRIMELKIWAKTMLTVQRHLDRVTRALDKIILKKAVSSAFVTSKNLMEQSCERISKYIINLSQSKINLINLNTICVKSLKGIDKTSAKILILKHIDGKQSGEIASLLGLSNRTYFRRLNLAYEKIESWLLANGFSSSFFEQKYACEGWIMEVYNKNLEFFENPKQSEISTIDVSFLKGIVSAISKAAHSSYS